MYLKVYIHSLSIITTISCMHKDLNQWFTTCNIHIGVLCDYYQDDQKNPEPLIYFILHGQVINHQPYDNKADVYSFAIVLSELMTSKVVMLFYMSF